MGAEANLEPVCSKGDDNLRRRIRVMALLGSALVLLSPVVALASLVEEFAFDGMGVVSVVMLFASTIPFVYANQLYRTRKRGTISVSGEIEALYMEILGEEQGLPIVKIEGEPFTIDQETFDKLKRVSDGERVTVRYFSGIGSTGRWVESIYCHRPLPSNSHRPLGASSVP